MTDKEMAEEYVDTLLDKDDAELDKLLDEYLGDLKLNKKQAGAILGIIKGVGIGSYLAGLEAGRPKWHKVADEDYARDSGWNDGEVAGYEKGFIDGAEHGYNKANEWHYVKDGLPEELYDVLCFVIHNEHRFVLEGYLRDGRWVLSQTYLNNEEVIAWKEIVLPGLEENKE